MPARVIIAISQRSEKMKKLGVKEREQEKKKREKNEMKKNRREEAKKVCSLLIAFFPINRSI
jgi:hypothetical protein